MRRTRTIAFALLALANLFWAGNWVTGRALRAAFDPITLNFWRWLVAALVLAPFALSQLRGQRHTIRRHAGLLVLLVFLVLFCVAETIPARVPAAYGAGAATIVAVHYWAYASGWSLKFRDPNLVLPLMVAGYSSGDTVAQLLHRADVALYDAKRTGRDRVVVA